MLFDIIGWILLRRDIYTVFCVKKLLDKYLVEYVACIRSLVGRNRSKVRYGGVCLDTVTQFHSKLPAEFQLIVSLDKFVVFRYAEKFVGLCTLLRSLAKLIMHIVMVDMIFDENL